MAYIDICAYAAAYCMTQQLAFCMLKISAKGVNCSISIGGYGHGWVLKSIDTLCATCADLT